MNNEDPTENIRRERAGELARDIETPNTEQERERLVKAYGTDNVWDSKQLFERFEVIGFMAPYCVVREKATGAKGSVEFQHDPRFYFNYVAD